METDTHPSGEEIREAFGLKPTPAEIAKAEAGPGAATGASDADRHRGRPPGPQPTPTVMIAPRSPDGTGKPAKPRGSGKTG